MKITIYGKQMTVRESLKAVIEKKLAKFDKFFGADTDAFVTCKTRKGDKIIEITVNYKGTTFRSEEENETFVTALDRAMESLERQIRKNKTKLEKRLRSGAFDSFGADDIVEETDFEVVRTKTIPVKPLSVDEAILQMNMLGHEFFMFRNSDNDIISVVYRRADGGYGLLEPQEDK